MANCVTNISGLGFWSFLDENKHADTEKLEKTEHATDVISLWILKDTFSHYLTQNQFKKGLSKSSNRFFIWILGKIETSEFCTSTEKVCAWTILNGIFLDLNGWISLPSRIQCYFLKIIQIQKKVNIWKLLTHFEVI